MDKKFRKQIDVSYYINVLVNKDAQPHILEERWTPLTNLAWSSLESQSICDGHRRAPDWSLLKKKMLSSIASW